MESFIKVNLFINNSMNLNIKIFIILLSAFFIIDESYARIYTHAPNPYVWKDYIETDKSIMEGEYVESYERYRKAAVEDGVAWAMYGLGLFYRNGWGRPVDMREACHWFKESSIRGIVRAMFVYGQCVEMGYAHVDNPGWAEITYERAGLYGVWVSFCYMGRLHMYGLGVPKNPEYGISLCYKAVEHGSKLAEVWLGKFYLDGDESVKDPEEAYKKFNIAEGYGISEAIYYKGVMRERGLVKDKLTDSALYYFDRAARAGYIPSYFKTGLEYYNLLSHLSINDNEMRKEFMIKSYFWLLAASRISKNLYEQEESVRLLEQLRPNFTDRYLKKFDEKVGLHLKKYPDEIYFED